MDEKMREFWRRKFETLGVMCHGHFRLHSGLHSDAYINKNALYTSPTDLMDFCWDAVSLLLDIPFDVIAGPESGGAKLAMFLSASISNFFINKDANYDWPCVYAEKSDGSMIFRRNQKALIRGKRVLIVDDVLVTGDSIAKTINAVREAGGTPVHIFVIWDRSADNFQPPDVNIISFDKLSLGVWEEAVCYLCEMGESLDKEFV